MDFNHNWVSYTTSCGCLARGESKLYICSEQDHYRHDHPLHRTHAEGDERLQSTKDPNRETIMKQGKYNAIQGTQPIINLRTARGEYQRMIQSRRGSGPL